MVPERSRESTVKTCRSCEIAGYLEEEARDNFPEPPDGLTILAHMWHDRCTGCDCEVEPCAGRILSFLRAVAHALRGLHVRRVPEGLGKESRC